ERGGTVVARVGRDVVDGDRGHRVVVADGAEAFAVRDRRAGDGGGAHEERLVALVGVVADDRDPQRLGGGAGRDPQRSDARLIVAVGGGGRCVERAPVHGDVVVRGGVEPRDQHEGRGPGVALDVG